MQRCEWANSSELMKKYHDTEWGLPLWDDRKLFEFLVLDAFQAGLSWSTILNKRENFRVAFDDFDPEKIVRYDEAKVTELLQNAGIVRNKLKIRAAIKNAEAFLKLQEEQGFPDWIWLFSGGRPQQNHWATMADIPVTSAASDAMSVALKKAGFSFVGSTICYAFMQAAGMVNDHLVSCPRHEICASLAR